MILSFPQYANGVDVQDLKGKQTRLQWSKPVGEASFNQQPELHFFMADVSFDVRGKLQDIMVYSRSTWETNYESEPLTDELRDFVLQSLGGQVSS